MNSFAFCCYRIFGHKLWPEIGPNTDLKPPCGLSWSQCGSTSGLCTKPPYAQFQFILLEENDDCDALELENLPV